MDEHRDAPGPSVADRVVAGLLVSLVLVTLLDHLAFHRSWASSLAEAAVLGVIYAVANLLPVAVSRWRRG